MKTQHEKLIRTKHDDKSHHTNADVDGQGNRASAGHDAVTVC